MKTMPPFEKIAEAYSAVADGRVHLRDDHAEVRSSDGKKTYTVTWNGNEYASSDSATYWQGYAGYPVIAVLLLRGKLAFSPGDASRFAGINWTELNARHKRDYAAALAEVMRGLAASGADTAALGAGMRAVYEELGRLELTVKRGRAKSPKRA